MNDLQQYAYAMANAPKIARVGIWLITGNVLITGIPVPQIEYDDLFMEESFAYSANLGNPIPERSKTQAKAKIEESDFKNTNTIYLADVIIHLGSTTAQTPVISIFVNHISAWGAGRPPLFDPDI
ncbi:MAG: hypothetical protein HN390_01430 [Anaerolineae bacterium]|jgi:hypothetical protein|nr:hypothetical protein [Anaerolineae bacterium]MBT7192114.1 hypothetical protein [Anaerolineae bacterium]